MGNVFESGLFRSRDNIQESGTVVFNAGSRDLVGFSTVVQEVGTILLQAATTTNDVDFVNIIIPKGELSSTSHIRLTVWCNTSHTTSGNAIQVRLDTIGVTSEGNSIEMALTVGVVGESREAGKIVFTLNQNTNSNSIIDIFKESILGRTVNEEHNTDVDRFTSGDADIFERGFTLRVNVRGGKALETQDSLIHYAVEKILA